MYERFKLKWSRLKNDNINTFLDYFHKEWVCSRNKNWFEGAAPNIPSTDNALESINGKIKSIYTLRSRMAVNVYLTNSIKMLRNWSKDTYSEKPFNTDIRVTKDCWERAYDCLRKQEKTIQRLGKSDTFILCSDSKLINKDYINERYNKLNDVDFDKLVIYLKRIHKITLDKRDWTRTTCSCSHFLKNYICYHVIVVCVNENLVEIPMQFKKVSIVPKAKSGRKPKAKRALVRQD